MTTIRRVIGTIVVCAALFGSSRAVTAAEEAATDPLAVSHDASLDVAVSRTEGGLIVDWRPRRAVAADEVSFTATLDGRTVVPSARDPFARGGRTASLVLIDGAGGEARDAAIRKAKRDALVLAPAAGRDDRLAYGVFGSTLRLIAPEAADATALPRALFAEPSFDERHDLSGALVAALRGLETEPAERKAIFVFTGGYDDGSLPLRSVARLARRDGVTLTFVMETPPRDRLPFALAALAAETGGRLVDEDEAPAFLAAPLAQLRAGGRLRFDFRDLRRPFWREGSSFELIARVGEEARVLRVPVEIAAAGVIGSVAMTMADHPAASGGAIALGIGLLAVATALVRARRRGAPPTSPRAWSRGSLVLLQDVGTGLAHVLRDGETTVGRAPDNDVVLTDAFVSRRHAVFSCRDGAVELTNLSAVNGTRVDGRPLETAPLAHGSLVTIGEVDLRVIVVTSGSGRKVT